jgi:acyl-CoA synthetase (AMP-forming)/AMP-acid ligase II
VSIHSAAQGTVVGAPASVTTDTGQATVLVLRDTRAGGLEVEYEVSCRDAELGRRVLERVSVGHHIVVLGTLRLGAVAGPLEDSVSAARITLLAEIVAFDLVAADERVPSARN